jgi:hypothetical protein
VLVQTHRQPGAANLRSGPGSISRHGPGARGELIVEASEPPMPQVIAELARLHN